jgi:hypothetical protein
MPPKRNYIAATILFIAVLSIPSLIGDPPAIAAEPTEIVDKPPVVESVGEDPAEPELIESALLDQGYLSDAVPLSYEDQDLLHAACSEFGIDYALALGQIEVETQFRNIVGDDGESEGYLQIQEKWHSDRMAALGVTSLMDPCGNFRVGCSLLADLIDQYGVVGGLTAYNSGSPGKSEYATVVMAAADRWTCILGERGDAY